MQKTLRVEAALRFRSTAVRSPHEEYGDQAVVLRGDLERARYRRDEDVETPKIRGFVDPDVGAVDEFVAHRLMVEALSEEGTPSCQCCDREEENESESDPVGIEISPEIKRLIKADDLSAAAALILKTGRKLRRAEEGVEVARRRHRKAHDDHETSKADLQRKLRGDPKHILTAREWVEKNYPLRKAL